MAEALPQFSVVTADGQPITSRETYKAATYRLGDEAGSLLAEGEVEIRGRGNNTWEFDKKPYKLKLAASTALAGMPANRHLVLLANYADKTLLRNEVAFRFSELLGMAWTPHSVQVEVTLNGEYVGIYQLTEQVRVGPDRVDIDELDKEDSAPAVVTGGYLIEIDNRRGEIHCPQSTVTAVVFCFNNPEDLTEPGREAQRTYIEGYIAETEAALFSVEFADPASGYAKYIDVQSAIDWYLVNEVYRNYDANFNSSVFLHKPRGGKLLFGPVWDFDRGLGNTSRGGVNSPAGWHVRSASWYARLFEDPAFDARVKARWRELREAGVFDQLQQFIDLRAAWLSRAQVRNFERWDILYTEIDGSRHRPLGPWEVQVADMKDWLRQRVEWIDTQLQP